MFELEGVKADLAGLVHVCRLVLEMADYPERYLDIVP